MQRKHLNDSKRPWFVWSRKVRPHLCVQLNNLTLAAVLQLDAESPDEVGSLEGGGEVLHSDSSSKLEDETQGFLSVAIIRPILVSLPLLVLHQLGDHHNHRNLLLDHHAPELLESSTFGSGCSEELLGAAWEEVH